MFTEVLTLAVAVVSSTNVQAGGDCFANRYTGDTYVSGNEWYCGVVPSDEIAVKDNTGKTITPATPVIVIVETIETTQEMQEVETVESVPAPVETPEPAPAVQEDKKPKCNNGEGNGAEGCSPANSDHANDDENNTAPKEDKSKK